MQTGQGVPERYLRQKGLLPSSSLQSASVLVAGLGGIGCSAATFLALSGIGEMTLLDRDVVELHNLNRQFLYSEEDIGKPKSKIARTRLAKINPAIRISAIANEASSIGGKAEKFSVIVDCTDNLESRLLLNKMAGAASVPLVFGSAVGWQGSVAALLPGKKGFCLGCVFGKRKTSEDLGCSSEGIVGPVAGAVGSLQAIEALKIISKIPCFRGLTYHDFLLGKSWRVAVKRDPLCPDCSKGAR